MELAKRATFTEVVELKKHRARHAARFERVIKQGKHIVRYYSDSESVLIGECVKTALTPLNGLKAWVYVERWEEAQWYGCAFENGDVQTEVMGSLESLSDALAYDLAKAQVIMVTEPVSLYEHKQCLHPKLGRARLSDFTLDAVKNSYKAHALAGFALVGGLLLGGFWWQHQPPAPLVTEPVKSQETVYVEAFHNKVPAGEALNAAVNALLELSLMPKGGRTHTASLSQKAVAVSIKSPVKSDKIARQWWQRRASLAQFYHKASHEVRIPMPPSTWQRTDVADFQRFFIDTLEQMGAKVVKKKTARFDSLNVSTFEISVSGELGQAFVLQELLNHPFITMNALTLSVNSGYQIERLLMSVDIAGEMTQ